MTAAQEEYAARQLLAKKRKGRRQSIPDAVLRLKIHGKHCRVCFGDRAFVDAAEMFTALEEIPSAIEAHHLVPRSKWRTGDPTVNDPDNLIPLCHDHHQDHHTTTNRVERHNLTVAEQKFVFHHTSESWFDRWYPEAVIESRTA